MTIIQGLIASITREGAPPPPPPFQPIDTGWVLGANWTVEIVAELTPTTFWATLWGNESFTAGLGHFAYFNSGGLNLNVGSPGGEDSYTITDNIATRAYWVFSHNDGGGVNVYRNAVLLTPSSSGYIQRTPSTSNSLLIGARHNNDGTGSTDTCPGNYLYYDRSSNGLDATYVQTQYDTFRTTFSIP